jgi:tetratricopeptide (TPR) repeat protein
LSADWYRSLDWDLEARAEFERRLARAHRESRPQYVRIKALALLESGDKRSRDAAQQLATRVVSDYPESSIDVYIAQQIIARCAERDGNLDTAVDQYRRAIAAATNHGSIDASSAYLALGELLLRLGRLSEAETALERYDDALMPFRDQQFRAAMARARIAAASQDKSGAAAHATRALSLLDQDKHAPQMPRHRDLARIPRDELAIAEMERLRTGA